MTNYERIRTMPLDELADFLGFQMIGLLNPSTCEGCPAREKCKEKDDDEYTSCIDSVKAWLEYAEPHKAWGLCNQCIIQHKSIDELAAFLSTIGRHIFDENSCQDCPAYRACVDSDGRSCEEAFRFWLEDEAEEENRAKEEPMTEEEQGCISMLRPIESTLLDLCDSCNGRLEDVICHIIERWEKGCACVYCAKSTVPDRSPDKDVCTPADCARGLAEWFRRMED